MEADRALQRRKIKLGAQLMAEWIAKNNPGLELLEPNIRKLIPGFKSLADDRSRMLLEFFARNGNGPRLDRGELDSLTLPALCAMVECELALRDGKKKPLRSRNQNREELRARVIEMRAAEMTAEEMCDRLTAEGFHTPESWGGLTFKAAFIENRGRTDTFISRRK